MIGYAARRLAGAVPTLLAVALLAFLLVRAAPGGPFDGERTLPAAIEANLRQAYHLDDPLWLQFGRYLAGVVQGDFGPSFRYRDFTVGQLIGSGFPASLALGGLALALAVPLGLALGAVAALRRNGWLDHAVMAVAMTGIAVPSFVVAPLLALLFGVMLRLLPVGGWGRGPQDLVLPVIALALPQVAMIARLSRGSLAEVLGAAYIRTARAKGLPDAVLLWRHALRPALLPVVSYLGPAAAALVTGSVVVEQIFGIPGIGRYFVQGAVNRDYTLVMGVVVLYGSLIILFNLLVDLLYGLLDPRVRYD